LGTTLRRKENTIMADINSLYELLREADKMAQGGDKQAQADAQKIYDTIKTMEREKMQAEETPPIVGGIVGGNIGASRDGGYWCVQVVKRRQEFV